MSVQDGLVQYFEDAANKLDCMLWRDNTEQVTSLG